MVPVTIKTKGWGVEERENEQFLKRVGGGGFILSQWSTFTAHC